ncbi:molybdenum cofactor synthesis domain-containing protein [Bartonella vinsonii subsp. arupensis Pm136co]|uniref:Molybdenum cofactor synthesis domain-containing protein n=1 Tax=Bartonella vinsonii subsp. arupensis Pm136co TaxID=1094561 RepID=A0ABP2QSL1_BARVI|nr:isocitrate/isopropylmalate family dehydrogenase [Bartonella vinsonii]EJF97910.1 molybdenum cofactor synthesis domain-containing protein [Bartonella vinsonii subsp. arupensis Pm136co]
MKKKVLVLPGDGVGPEVCDAALMVLEQFQLPIELSYGAIGWECWKQEGDPVPQATWQKINDCDAVLLGAVTCSGKEAALKELAPHLRERQLPYVSPVVQLRQKLGLFANIRPVRYIVGSKRPFHFCVIRENSEGLYAGLDFRGVSPETATWLKHPNLTKYGLEEAAWTVQLQTRFGLERLFEYAFSYARRYGFKRVTFADKPNVMRESGQFAQEIFEKVAENYSEIEADIHNVDAVALWIVTKPEQFGVIVAENMFGDILSDLGAGVMGGLGLAPSANVGSKIAYFEPVHGSAPRLAGQNKANPSAMLYTTALLLEHLGFQDAAQQLSESVDQVIRAGKTVTYDLGGLATTRQMAEAVLHSLVNPVSVCRAAIITVGDELLSGQYLNTNLQDLSQSLNKRNIQVTRHFVCADQLQQISETVIACLGQEDLIIISGGLGPTSDDKMRDAIAQAVQLVGQSSAPLAQHLIEEFENHFRPYLVGAEITTARQQLAMYAEVHWLANDPMLLKYFHPIEKSAKNIPQLEVEVSLSPSLEVLEKQKESLGHATMTVRIDGYGDDQLTFPYTRPLLGVVLQEYAAWSVLKRYLKAENYK